MSFAVMLLGILVIYKFKNFFSKIGTTEVAYFWMPNTIPMLLLSISVFKIFLDIKLDYNKIINKLASTTLGIYLLHDGKLDTYIWTYVFKSKEHLNNNYPILYIIEAAAIIFIVGAIIDLIRQFIEKHTVNKILYSKAFDNIGKRAEEFIDKIKNIL